MFKLAILLKRRAGLSVEEFRDYYESRHVPLCMTYMAGAARYVRRYPVVGAGAPEPEFDVITELWFDNLRARDLVLRTLAADAMPPDVIADELRFIDRAKSRAYALEECETDRLAASAP